MSIKSVSMKTTAIVLASTFLATGLMPIATASAHDRHNAGSHNGHYQNWNKRKHRKFHNKFGKGFNGQQRHQNRVYKKKRKKNNNGDLIAAGIIGLALGAIIADSASKNHQSSTTYRYSEPQYGSAYQPQYDNYQQPQYNSGYNEPEVIRYNDVVSYEPWTEGWRAWCEDNFRSFNVRTGTYRGYDGLDHFCVPK